MGADALLVVPPFLKVVSGPLLGPAMLMGAGRSAGHRVQLADLNNRWIREHVGASPVVGSTFVGDHDRPSELLRSLQTEFAVSGTAGLRPSHVSLPDDPVFTLAYSHEDVLAAARRLSHSRLGRWIRGQLLASMERPDVVGLSVMYSGQVLAALATSILARDLWPQALIVWGGAHVTALRSAICSDATYGTHVDRFVFGYAERTWTELLGAVDDGTPLPTAAVKAGQHRQALADDDARVVPVFDHLGEYGWGRLTLPAQSSRGCAYGRCTFCTYPAVEGRYRPLDLQPVSAIVDEASRVGAAVSFKDSLIVPGRLETIAETVAGRVAWSACTKLHVAFDKPFLRRLKDAGCATLEFGLETLSPNGQLLIDKKQALPLFLRVLDAAAEAGVAVVVNYITGFPGTDRVDEARWLDRVRVALEDRPGLVAKLEHNTFQLERMSPMGRQPGDYGLRVVQSWPWASVMAWEAGHAVALPRRARALQATG